MDITQTTAPKSDQLNFDDLASTGPRTVTITEVKAGTAEQPVNVELAEFPGRPYKPSKSMRRVLVAAWGPEAAAYAGRRMTLYGDPEVMFGSQKVGGIKIKALSHIDQALKVSLTVSKGRRAPFTVEALKEPTAAQIAASNDPGQLRGWGLDFPALRPQLKARMDELSTAAPDGA